MGGYCHDLSGVTGSSPGLSFEGTFLHSIPQAQSAAAEAAATGSHSVLVTALAYTV